MVRLEDIADIIEEKAPLSTQESWDNSGWQIRLDDGENAGISKILVALELNREVAEEAVSQGAELIVCHHPLIFGGLKSVDDKSVTGNIIAGLIRKGISVYATHTPFDKCSGGNNDYLAGLLGLTDAGLIPGDESGICRMGMADGTVSAGEMTARFAEKTGQDIRFFRLAGKMEQPVKQVGICTGSGAEFLDIAAAAGCDLFITGDVKYHTAHHALELGIGLLDLGHYGSEQIFTENMAGLLKRELAQRGLDAQVIESSINLNPFTAV